MESFSPHARRTLADSEQRCLHNWACVICLSESVPCMYVGYEHAWPRIRILPAADGFCFLLILTWGREQPCSKKKLLLSGEGSFSESLGERVCP